MNVLHCALLSQSWITSYLRYIYHLVEVVTSFIRTSSWHYKSQEVLFLKLPTHESIVPPHPTPDDNGKQHKKEIKQKTTMNRWMHGCGWKYYGME